MKNKRKPCSMSIVIILFIFAFVTGCSNVHYIGQRDIKNIGNEIDSGQVNEIVISDKNHQAYKAESFEVRGDTLYFQESGTHKINMLPTGAVQDVRISKTGLGACMGAACLGGSALVALSMLAGAILSDDNIDKNSELYPIGVIAGTTIFAYLGFKLGEKRMQDKDIYIINDELNTKEEEK